MLKNIQVSIYCFSNGSCWITVIKRKFDSRLLIFAEMCVILLNRYI